MSPSVFQSQSKYGDWIIRTFFHRSRLGHNIELSGSSRLIASLPYIYFIFIFLHLFNMNSSAVSPQIPDYCKDILIKYLKYGNCASPWPTKCYDIPAKFVLACFETIFVFTMCWFETISSSPCARLQRKLKVNARGPNIYMCDLKWYTDNKAQLNTWKTHHALNHNTKFYFVLEHNISGTCKHDDVIKWKHFPRCWPFVRGIHRTKASDAELCYFLWSAPE